jgi:hypothetical protein
MNWDSAEEVTEATSSSKGGALTLLMIGSIFMFFMSCWNILSQFLFYGYYYYGYFGSLVFWIPSGLEFVASLLLMIGFVMFRGEQSKQTSQIGYLPVPPGAAQAQGAPMRFCPKCGRQIPGDAEFCGFCRLQAEGQK